MSGDACAWHQSDLERNRFAQVMLVLVFGTDYSIARAKAAGPAQRVMPLAKRSNSEGASNRRTMSVADAGGVPSESPGCLWHVSSLQPVRDLARRRRKTVLVSSTVAKVAIAA